MKQQNIIYRFFKSKELPGTHFCINVLADHKLNVYGIHFITVKKSGELPDNYMHLPRQYMGGKSLKSINIIEGLRGPYHSGSLAPVRSLDTFVPDSMDYELHSAVIDLKENVGGINEYVQEKLGYSTVEEMATALGAEQVDAVAAAIYNIEEKNQGLIIGDQTGIGKGRVAAAIIRYAALRGKKPIFMTLSDNLLSDMYRDLEDIGSAHLKPFIVNAASPKTKIKNKRGEVIFEPPQKIIQNKILQSKSLSDEYDIIMLTYHQINGDWEKKPTIKQQFINAMAADNVLILDESHKAGGDLEVSNTARFMYETVDRSEGVVFLSATFAKRPDNMPLYAKKTSMGDANLSREDLVFATKRGGVALQEVISSNLVREGQMIRRQRQFDGIEVNYIYLDKGGALDFGAEDKEAEHKAISDRITSILRDIIKFQRQDIASWIKNNEKDLVPGHGEMDIKKGTKDGGVDNTPYFSKIFNVFNQILFAIKAEAVADRAIKRLKEGKKPVIAFSSTMEAFLSQMTNENLEPVSDGDRINTDFSAVLKKGLDGVMKITITDGSGEKSHMDIPVESLSPQGQEKYFEIMDKIRKAATGISITPIDILKRKITDAGYTVAEVTGRSLEVELDKTGTKGTVRRRKKEPVNDLFTKFNNNEADVLMINQSGSTGASAHAVPTMKVPASEVRQRVMIILQSELDVNNEVQKRGRINRTGQIIKPIYDYLYSAIPAEKRLAMMLQKKLKSLDANTTSDQKNSEAMMKSDDFLNKYGNKVVWQFLTEYDNRELTITLGYEKSIENEDPPTPDIAHQASGRVALLKTKDQEYFYNEILSRYEVLITQLYNEGLYDLEIEKMDLQAETLDKKIAITGKSGAISAFGGHTYIEKAEINNLRRPFSQSELNNAIVTALDGNNSDDIRNTLIDNYKSFIQAALDKQLKEISEKIETKKAEITENKKYQKLTLKEEQELYIRERQSDIYDEETALIDSAKKATDNKASYMLRFFKNLKVGQPMLYNHQGSDEKAVFLGFDIDPNKPNPYAPSAVRAKIAVANSLKLVTLPLSGDTGNIVQAAILATTNAYSYQINDIIQNWSEYCKKSSASRKIAFLYTGNLLQAYTASGDVGQTGARVINYTTIDGAVKKGILMPDGYNPNEGKGAGGAIVPLPTALRVIKSMTDGNMIETSVGVSIMRTWNSFRIFTKSLSVQKWSWLIKNQDMLNLIIDYGGFQKTSNTWAGNVNVEDIEKALNIIHEASGATVKLTAAALELIKDLIEKKEEDSPAPSVFPKLVELEIKLFKMLEDENLSGIETGLGLPQNTMVAFSTLKNAHPLSVNNNDTKGTVLAEMISEVAKQTNNFAKPENIGIETVEVRALLDRENITAGRWLRQNKSLRRSDADVVEWLSNQVQSYLQKTDTVADEDDIEMQIAIAEAEAAAAQAQLELKS